MTYPFWPWSGDADGDRSEHTGAAGEARASWSADHRWVAARSADERLAGRAADVLRLEPLIRGRRLEIYVQNGVIILLGELASDEAWDAVGRRAWSVPGVVDVCNQLTAGHGEAAGR